jgi:hypothetical protein
VHPPAGTPPARVQRSVQILPLIQMVRSGSTGITRRRPMAQTTSQPTCRPSLRPVPCGRGLPDPRAPRDPSPVMPARSAAIFITVYSLGNGTTKVLDTKTIYQYPWNYNSSATGPSPTAVFTNALTQTQAVSYPSPFASPFPTPSIPGDAPRFSVKMQNLYPAGTTSVIIYPGTPVSPSPNTATTIANSAATAPNLASLQASGGLWTSAPSLTFETAPYIPSTTSPQTYTIAAIQTLPSPAYVSPSTSPVPPNPAILNTLTFTVGFNVNSTVGTVK